jgi:hypothetical protein
MKLPAGTLMLEGTPNAVTPAQAKGLLPLWQMIRTLQGSTTASQVEVEAVWEQVEATMTAEQLAAIEEMDQEDMRALFEELGMGRQQGDSESDDEQGGGFGGPPDMGGMMPPGGGEGGAIIVGPGGGEGGPGMGPGGFGNLDPEAQATAMAGRGGMVMGFGSGLTDAVIELLESRAAES